MKSNEPSTPILPSNKLSPNMMRQGHASTLTLGIYNTSSPHTSRASSPAYNYDSRPSTPSEYLLIHLTNDDPTNALFLTSSGQTLFQSRTAYHRVRSTCHDNPNHKLSRTSSVSSSEEEDVTPLVTRVSRRYGKTARAVREAALMLGDKESAEEGLLIAEMEWLTRTQSSRIRFGDGLAVNKQNVVDVRVDEFLKSTNGRYVIKPIWSTYRLPAFLSSGFSKMFATPDGRTYKWKTDSQFSAPAELVECDEGRRVSGPLVVFQPGYQQDAKSTLRVATRLLPIIDQIIVTWVIMERERRTLSSISARSSTSGSSSGSV